MFRQLIARKLHNKCLIVHKRGKDVLKDGWINKGSSFSYSERERLGIRGLIPPRRISLQQQHDRFMNHFFDEGMTPVRQYFALQSLQDRNETLYYKAVIDHIKHMAPVVYTPTVGRACQTFSNSFRLSRGLYFSVDDIGECTSIVYNWPSDHVDVIVVTDGSRVLGLGDLGIHGMAISIGKLTLYTAAGGIDPHRTLPVCIDVGTNNKELLNNPLYLGIQKERCDDETYFKLLDGFMNAVFKRWPNVLVQFEDFQNQRAVALLERYRKNRLCFNDDIQGTGAVAVAGILSSLRCKKLNFSDLASQRILIAGGGSAGMGVANALLEYLMVRCGLTKEEASKIFYICDNIGLLTEKRKSMSGYVMLPNQETYLRSEIEMEGMSILDTVKRVKPSILIGLSGVGGIFTTEVCEEMGKINEQPIIFPMSNPSDHAECSANVAFAATNGRAIFASGSPFNNVIMNGKTCFANQGNNMFIFPGLGLGCVVGKCNIVSNTMILTAAETLAATMSQSDIDQGMVYPDVSNIREVSSKIALAVILQARKEHNCDNSMNRLSEDEIYQNIKEYMYKPEYPEIIYRPPGIGE